MFILCIAVKKENTYYFKYKLFSAYQFISGPIHNAKLHYLQIVKLPRRESVRFMDILTRHRISHAAGEDIYNFFRQNAESLLWSGQMHQSFRQLRRLVRKEVPKVKFDFALRNEESGDIEWVKKSDTIARAGRKTAEVGYLKIKHLKQFHQGLHGGGTRNDVMHVILSNDGIQESRSFQNSLNTFSLRFRGCKVDYPICIIRNKPGFKVDWRRYLKRIIKHCRYKFNLIFLPIDRPKKPSYV